MTHTPVSQSPVSECDECGMSTPTYFLMPVKNRTSEDKWQLPVYSCKRHLTTIIDSTEGSVVVRKVKET